MAYVQPISGAFGVFYKAPDTSLYSAIGHVDDGGVERHWTPNHQMLKSAFTGDMPLDGIYAGRDETLHLTVIEVGNAVLRSLMHSHDVVNDEGVIHQPTRPLGHVLSATAGSLKLLPLEGTPAANYNSVGNGGSGMLYSRVIVENGQEINEMMKVQARVIPLVLRPLPYVVTESGVNKIRLFQWVNETCNLTQFNFAGAPL